MILKRGENLHQSLICGVWREKPRVAMTATEKSIRITAALKQPLIGPHTNRCEKLFDTQCAFLLVHMRCSRFVSLNEKKAGRRVLERRKAYRLRFYWWLDLIFKRYGECRLVVWKEKLCGSSDSWLRLFFIQYLKWRVSRNFFFAILTNFDFPVNKKESPNRSPLRG